jgi:hypothetical protein
MAGSGSLSTFPPQTGDLLCFEEKNEGWIK